jgi:hypothetical protein
MSVGVAASELKTVVDLEAQIDLQAPRLEVMSRSAVVRFLYV